MNSKSRFSKIVSFVAFCVIAVLTVYVIFCLYIAKKNDAPTFIFGCGFSIVITDSMSPDIEVGELVIFKKVDFESLKQGDDIVFRRTVGELKGYNIIHRIVDTDFASGEITTRGTNPKITSDDDEKVTQNTFFGLKIGQSKFLGAALGFFKNPVNWIFLIVFIITLAVIIKQLKKIFSLNKQLHTENCESLRKEVEKELLDEGLLPHKKDDC